MKKVNVLRQVAVLVSLLTILTYTVNSTFGIIITKTDDVINTFTVAKSAASDIVISKTVEHPLGDDYIIPDNISFDFQVDLGSLYANTDIKTTDGNITADQNGSINVSVKPGQSIGIEDVDVGTQISVSEIQQHGSGFSVKDSATKQATVLQGESTLIDFVNVYTPESVTPSNITVEGIKILEGREWQMGDSFSFKLEQKAADNSWTTIQTKTVTYEPNNREFNTFDFSAEFSALNFDKVGNYDFRMTEVAGDLSNINYDSTVNTFNVKVTDTDMDGRLEIADVLGAQNTSVAKENGNFKVCATFNNTFVADIEDLSVDVTVNKTVKNIGKTHIGPDGFEFVLKNTSNGDALKLETDSAGKAIFNLKFSEEDIGKTYKYKLYETDEDVQGITYDTDVYDIEIAIALGEDNRLVAQMKVNGKDVNAVSADFENIYKAEDPQFSLTGDTRNFLPWIIALTVSAGVCLAVVLIRKRQVNKR